jgi:ketosteroid isomerase-like protein
MTNRELVERQIDSSNRLAVDEVAELFWEDAVWDASRSIGPARGVYRGREEIEPFLLSYVEAFESVIATPVEIHERGDWIAVDTRVRMRGRGSGVEVEARGGRVYELRDGKIARYIQFQNFADAREFVEAQDG